MSQGTVTVGRPADTDPKPFVYSANQLRPFGIEHHDGQLHITCGADATKLDATDLLSSAVRAAGLDPATLNIASYIITVAVPEGVDAQQAAARLRLDLGIGRPSLRERASTTTGSAN